MESIFQEKKKIADISKCFAEKLNDLPTTSSSPPISFFYWKTGKILNYMFDKWIIFQKEHFFIQN